MCQLLTFILNLNTHEAKRQNSIAFKTKNEALAAVKQLKPKHVKLYNETSKNIYRYLIE